MTRYTCPSCGHVYESEDPNPACPNCGVFYAKAKARATGSGQHTAKAKESAPPSPAKGGLSRGALISMAVVVILIAMAVVYLVIPQKVSGKVFIVTRGMTSVYLPLVTVKAYDADTLRRFMEKKDAEYRKAHTQRQQLKDKIDILKDQQRDSVYVDQYKKIEHKIVDLQARSDLTLHVDQPDFWMQGAPAALATAQSDDKGAFALKLRRGHHYIVVAKAQRYVVGETEHYFWYIPYDAGFDWSGKVQLDNQNYGKPGSKRSLFPMGF